MSSMGIDVDWCLNCGTHYNSSDTEPYCSQECLYLHAADSHSIQQAPPSPLVQPIPIHSHHNHVGTAASSYRSDSFSELDLSSSYRPHSPRQPRASEWLAKGTPDIEAWAASVPLGVSPSTSSTHSSHKRRISSASSRSSASGAGDDSDADAASSITPPSRPRTRNSTLSSRASSSAAAPPSSTLRPHRLSVSARKPAPPKLFVSHTQHVKSPPTPPTPTPQHINPHTSVPSLTAHSSATASLTSIATPASLLASSSRPSSRPVSPPVSVHGDDYADSDANSDMLPHSFVQRTRQHGKQNKTLFANLAAHLRSWASSNAMSNHPPYSTAHVAQLKRTPAPLPSHPSSNSTTTTDSHARSKTVTPPPVPSTRQVQQQQRPTVKDRETTVRLREPIALFHDHELSYGFADEKVVMGMSGGSHSGVVRMGRGLVGTKRAVVASAEAKDREEQAFRSRGRKVERARQ